MPFGASRCSATDATQPLAVSRETASGGLREPPHGHIRTTLHGDLVMLGSFLALTLLSVVALAFGAAILGNPLIVGLLIVAMIATCALFCAALNVSVDFLVYRPLRNAPRL